MLPYVPGDATRFPTVGFKYIAFNKIRRLLTLFRRGLFFQKKFFWFGTEPVESKTLSSYLRGEKPEVGNHNVAWAAHTGKGLLFFSKKEADKATPASIINLVCIINVLYPETSNMATG